MAKHVHTLSSTARELPRRNSWDSPLVRRPTKGLLAGTTLTALIAGAASALTLLSAPLALAGDEPIFLPIGQGCADFNLQLSSTGGNLHTKTFLDKNGDPVRVLTAGKGVNLTYTNFGPDPEDPVAGKSVTIKTAGSVTSIRTNPDGTSTYTSTGHNGLVLFPTDVPAGPTTTQYIGRLVFDVAPDTGVFTLISTAGQARNICSELAD